MASPFNLSPLFEPYRLNSVDLLNRIVMAPMTRARSENGVPDDAVAEYYAGRARGGVGLIITEGTFISPSAAGGSFGDPNCIPCLYKADALAGWKHLVNAVHKENSKIFCQLWHIGSVREKNHGPNPGYPSLGPSAIVNPGNVAGEIPKEMSQADIDNAIAEYVKAAENAQRVGFDGIEIHAAHGYFIDQFFWDKTNQRKDQYGGKTIGERTRFACEVVRAIRNSLGTQFPILLRFSQWKLNAYDAKLANTPQELEQFLSPLVDAGVDAFHCSTRKFFEPEFPGSGLNLAGWAKKLTAKPTITVGSVGLDVDFIDSYAGKPNISEESKGHERIGELTERMQADEFDLVAVGRALIGDPDWPNKIKQNHFPNIIAYQKSMLKSYP